MEEKLAAFRKKQAAQKPLINWKSVSDRFSSFVPKDASKIRDKRDEDEEEEEVKSESIDDWKIILIKCLLWLTLFVIFIRLEFGAIYFIISLLYLIWTSMNSRRRRNQLSAYSVFNKNFEKIQGTFSAEDYDRQLRHGGPTVLSS